MRLSALAACTVLAACSSGGTTQDVAGFSATSVEPNLDRPSLPELSHEDRGDFALILNDLRGGLQRVEQHDTLTTVAEDYSRDITSHGRTIASGDNLHVGRDGSTVADRVLEAGYDYHWVGENIAQGYRSNDSVLDAWMASSQGHREVILESRAEDFGIGRSGSTWVLIMGEEHDEPAD